ncbi:hypothetical protein [uncultured Brachyspira sp.]|uniref:hypothetical protein n=1 Tax=uncultured Brachyspira sp. TaxID=221953 RepID=UPI00262A6A0F|nr:hypothetical protein [uncultured Brachyspira sp.]
MIIKQNVIFNKTDKKDYYIYIDKKNNRGIFTPYFKGSYNSFFYDFSLDKCRIFHKNAKSYSILDLSLDGQKVITISVDNNNSSNNTLKIVEIGTNKVFLELSGLYVYEAYFTANPKLIICRAKEFNRTNVFLYNIEDKKIVYTLKENTFISDGAFDEKRTIFTYPSAVNNKILYQVNLLTLNDGKIQLENPNMKITNIYSVGKDFILTESNKSIAFYSNRKIVWKVELSSVFNCEYDGGIFYLDKKIYFDNPAISKDNMENDKNPKESMILYRIDIDTGNIEYLLLPVNIKYKRFTTMFGSKIIDTTGNILDIRSGKTLTFPLKLYK